MRYGRNTDGTFCEGIAGRPKGARNKKTLALEALLDGEAEALTQVAIEKALEGDSVALRLCLERISSAPKDRPVAFFLPSITSTNSASQAASSVQTRGSHTLRPSRARVPEQAPSKRFYGDQYGDEKYEKYLTY